MAQAQMFYPTQTLYPTPNLRSPAPVPVRVTPASAECLSISELRWPANQKAAKPERHRVASMPSQDYREGIFAPIHNELRQRALCLAPGPARHASALVRSAAGSGTLRQVVHDSAMQRERLPKPEAGIRWREDSPRS